MTTDTPSYATWVDGHLLPHRVGGHPALDFCNTRADWRVLRASGEWLGSYAHLVAWVGFAELLDRPRLLRVREHAGLQCTEAQLEGVLERARGFRRALRDCLLDPDDREAFAAVAEVVDEAHGLTSFALGPDGLATRRLSRDDGAPELPLFAVALAAADLLASVDRFLVRACASDDCGWLFLDRRGRRRWCDMATCGNRAKVRAHAQRRRGR